MQTKTADDEIEAPSILGETSVHEVDGKLDTSVTFITTYEDRKLL